MFIGDPAFLRRPDHPLNKDRIDWQKLLGSKYPVLRQLRGNYGILSSTGWGDGTYEVWARVVPKTVIGALRESSTSKRVAELRIVFLDLLDDVDPPTNRLRARIARGAAVQVGSGNRMVVKRHRPKKRKVSL